MVVESQLDADKLFKNIEVIFVYEVFLSDFFLKEQLKMSANWTQFFELRNATIGGKNIEYYAYKDRSVIILPADLPMPPTDTFYFMFFHCEKLQDISALSNWDVSNVKSMRAMFYYCRSLQDITALSNWDVSNVKDMCSMFCVCGQLKNITALSNWNVSNVERMYAMFSDCNELQDITALSNWNVSNVLDMYAMFSDCKELQDISALSNWDISSVKDMEYMFSGCNSLMPETQDDKEYSNEKYLFEIYITFRKKANQQINSLQKENAELKTRITSLEEKLAKLQGILE